MKPLSLFVALVLALSVAMPLPVAYASDVSLQVADTSESAGVSEAIEAIDSPEGSGDPEPAVVYAGVGLTVRGKVRGLGWTAPLKAGSTVGDTGGNGLNALSVALTGAQDLTGSIAYRVYKRSSGWKPWVKNGARTSSYRNVEAVKVKLTGEVAQHYDVLYRTYVSGKGWQPWVKNGAASGSVRTKTRVNAIQVKLSPKTEEASGKTTETVGIRYETRFKTNGWQAWKGDGGTAGKASGAKALTGLAVRADSGLLGGGVKYRAYCQDTKWGDWAADGAFAGNKKKRLEAIKIKLTGTLAKEYDVYYRAYCQSSGWLDWTKNGAVAGSTGFNLRLQAFQVKLVQKGGKTPGATQYPTVNLLEQSKTLNGIDISSWQSGIDIYAVQADFIIVKATEGTNYINPSFRQWADQVLASGKQLGLYHFATDAASAKAQADYFYRAVKPYIGRAALFLDWENTSYSNVLSKGPSFAKAWLDRVYNRTGVKPLIYINQGTTWDYNWSAVASKYKLWLAQYLYGNEYKTGYLDGVTHWGIGYWSTVTVYQYSSTATLSGYGGYLDVNKFYGSILSWRKLAHAK